MKEILSFHRRLTRKQRQLLVLFILVLMPIGAWAEPMTKTYTFTGSTPKTNVQGMPIGGTLECNSVTTWELSGYGTSIDEYREITVSDMAGATSQESSDLTSIDHFYKVTRITINVTMPDYGDDQPNIQFECNRQIEGASGSGELDIEFDFTSQAYYPNGPLTIGIYYVFLDIFTINSITVEYERTDLGLYFYYNTGSITEWSLNWSDCLNNNVYIPPLYDYTDDDTQFPVVFTSSNENVVTIDDSGVYTLVGPGQSTVTATFDGNTKYNPETASYTLTINDDRPPLSQCRAELNPESREYNGGRQSTVMRIYSPEGAPLVEGTDFSVSQSDNMVNAGSYTITATALPYGRYSGQLTATYTITPVSLENAVITVSPTSLIYNGTAQEPAVSVAFMNQKTNELGTPLTAGTDYTVSYSNNTNVTDKATVTITGKGNYTSTKTATFSITKATPTLSFSANTAQVELGEVLQAPTLNNPRNVTVTYTSSSKEVATVDAQTGIVTPLMEGETTIKATFEGNSNYEEATAQYLLIVTDNAVKYDLWIGDTRVTERNKTDILSDGSADQGKAASFQYIPSLNKLFITNNTDYLTIETTNDKGVAVYLAPNSTNAVGNIVYTGNNNAPLTITTDGNYPGTISLSANSNVISGFSSLTLEQNLVIMSPEDIAYDGSNRRLGTTHATIGVPLAPITEQKTIIPKGDELQPESGSDDINKVVDDILYTLGNVNDSNGDGYDDGGFIVINSVTTDQQAVRITQAYTPGTNEYLEGFKGLTFMIPAGKGKIAFDVQTINGHAMKVMVGDAAPVIVESAEKGTVEIPYNVAEPTYVYAYNAGKVGDANSARSVQKGKMTTVHIKIYGTSVKPGKVKSANSAAEASGGEYQGETKGLEGQETETDEEIEASKGDVNGDETANVADIIGIVNALVGNHSPMFDKRAADVNSDGIVNGDDIVIIVNKIIKP